MRCFQMSSAVQLNVGGKNFEAPLATLTNGQSQKLTEMFAAGPPSTVGKDGVVCIDRDGSGFGDVLKFLGGDETMPDDKRLLRRLSNDAEFFGIPALKAAVQYATALANNPLARSLIRTHSLLALHALGEP